MKKLNAQVVAEIFDLHIAVIAGRIRGAIAFVENSTLHQDQQDSFKQYCIIFLKLCWKKYQQLKNRKILLNMRKFLPIL